MPASEAETLATLRLLVAAARADGHIAAEERDLLASSLSAAALPGGLTADALLAETPDVAAQCAAVTSKEGRDAAYNAVVALVGADGDANEAERAYLERVRKGLGIPEERATLLGRMIAEAKDTVLPSHIRAVADPATRAKEIAEDTRKYAVFTAVLGAFPVPIVSLATDVAIVGLQVKLVRDIGQYWGHAVDNAAARSILLGLGLGTGARIAVSNLAKFVPVLGSVVGAAGAYASTWALGKVADQYFASGGKAEVKTLKDAFRKAEKEGRADYERNKGLVEAAKREKQARFEALNAEVASGRISQAEYEKRLDAMA